ncbi:MAG: hypothetical protein JXA14_09745 [Anaerolineae bacterium]|nr:hypothetical protein [Anaerolineae bacterium]
MEGSRDWVIHIAQLPPHTLNENRLVAIGTHEELLESTNFYRTLMSNQQIIAQ